MWEFWSAEPSGELQEQTVAGQLATVDLSWCETIISSLYDFLSIGTTSPAKASTDPSNSRIQNYKAG